MPGRGGQPWGVSQPGGGVLHEAACFVTLNIGGVSLVGGSASGGVLHDKDNDNNDTCMTPLG